MIPISMTVNFQTIRDGKQKMFELRGFHWDWICFSLTVPGPITEAQIIPNNGILLQWKPPHNPNGEIFHYQLEWTLNNVSHKQNVSELSFKFPDTTNDDRFKIVVRAFGPAGFGNPLIINPEKWKNLPGSLANNPEKPPKIILDSFMIFAIIFISFMLLVLVVGYIFCRRNRYCKKSNGIINSEQSSFPPTTSPLTENIRMDEVYEMQTLIPTSQLMMANGKDTSIKSDNPSNGGINMKENQKILRTSTPTDESLDQMCIELPPIKCDEGLKIRIDSKPNGYQKKPSPTVLEQQKDLRNGSVKVNGNSSPYKCFQVSFSFFRGVSMSFDTFKIGIGALCWSLIRQFSKSLLASVF